MEVLMPRWVFFVCALLLGLSAGTLVSCGGGDDDDDDGAVTDDTTVADDTGTDDDVTDDAADDADDDTVSDDTASDDTATDDTVSDDTADDDSGDDDTGDDDDTTQTELVLDDGSAESGRAMDHAGWYYVQAFTPPAYPATLVDTDLYIFSDVGLANQVRLVVFYSTTVTREPTPGTPVYRSDPFTIDWHDAWDTIDLSAVPALETPVASGQFWIGLEFTVDSGTGPYIGFDTEGSPNNEVWFYNGAWYRLADYAVTGSLMIRPTIQHPIVK
jgi:hypothetical protein